MAAIKVTNVSDGPRLLNSIPPVLVQPGEMVEAEVSEAEVKAFALFGNFEEAKPAKGKAKADDAE